MVGGYGISILSLFAYRKISRELYLRKLLDNNINFEIPRLNINVEHLSLVVLDPEPGRGDVNGDGVWNLSDVVALQKWLLAVPDAKLEQWENGDFYADGRIDALDLCLMRREILL